MTDINSPTDPQRADDEKLTQAIELLYFAYRDFTGECDAILEPLGFGRAQHRVLYFVGRNPGVSVAGLLDILAITKQSLSRVLSQLIERRYVDSREGTRDRRQRLLYLTDKGQALELQLTTAQRARFASAFDGAGADAANGFRAVMLGLMNGHDRERF